MATATATRTRRATREPAPHTPVGQEKLDHPRQFICESRPMLRQYLPRCSDRSRPADLPDDLRGMFAAGKFFDEQYAQFVNGAFITDDPAVADELRRLSDEDLAPIYEDEQPRKYRCPDGFTTDNVKAYEQHMATLANKSLPTALYDAANDPL